MKIWVRVKVPLGNCWSGIKPENFESNSGSGLAELKFPGGPLGLSEKNSSPVAAETRRHRLELGISESF